MGLLSKTCTLCGNASGMLHSKRLADGYICSDCVDKLSPWFNDYRNTTVAEIARQLQYRKENREKLDSFEVTEAWGVKRYPDAPQFIFDKDQRIFVIVEGPAETFRERNPDMIWFDQVEDLYLEVDEYWTEGKGDHEPRPVNQDLPQEKYKDVYWRYDFYLNMKTTHPYVPEIRYQMNYKPIAMKVPQRGAVYRRGVDIGGIYRGEDIEILAARLGVFSDNEENTDGIRKEIDEFLHGSKDDMRDEIYYKQLSKMAAHVSRAARISQLLDI